MPPPKSKVELKRFLGMLSYYRRFINDFGQVSSCLFKMTILEATFIMTDETLKAFETLRKCLLVCLFNWCPFTKRTTFAKQ